MTSARSTVEPSGVDHHGGGEAARSGLRGKKFLEPLAVGIEHRLGAAEIEGHGHDLAADRLGVLAHISVGDDERLLDHGARACREETIEAAIERGAGDHGNQHGRHRGDDREKADDLHVQARASVAAPARLHHHPDFAADDGEQQKPGGEIRQQELDHHFVDRRDRRQARQHHEGGRRRQKREADRDGPDQPRSDRHRRVLGGSNGSADAAAAATGLSGAT